MRKIENGLPGYFTVEAAMVMPIVFAVYIFMISMLIYIYEGCIWEQNGFRMLVQKPYLDGYVRMHGDVTETKIGEKEICRYILEKNKEEEKTRYILGRDIETDYYIKGGYRKINRNINYPIYLDMKKNFSISTLELCPEEYIREMKFLQKVNVEGAEDKDDKQ